MSALPGRGDTPSSYGIPGNIWSISWVSREAFTHVPHYPGKILTKCNSMSVRDPPKLLNTAVVEEWLLGETAALATDLS